MYKNEMVQKVELLKLVARHVGGKDQLLEMLDKQLNLKLPAMSSYKRIIGDVQEADLEADFCQSFLQASNFNEAWDHYILAQGLALFDMRDLCEIADFLSKKGDEWKYDKTNKGKVIESIFLNATGNQLADCLKRMMSSGQIEPSVIQQRRSVIGPLGVTFSIQSRTSAISDDLIQFIQTHFSEQHFEEFVKQSGSPPLASQFKIPSDPAIRSLAYIQHILTNYQDSEILKEFNTMVRQNLLEINDVEQYWTLIATPCGVVQQAHGAEENLAQIIKEYHSSEELTELLELKGYQYTNLDMGLQELCLSENPEQLLQELFGRKELNRIARDKGLVVVEKVRDTSELVKIIALRLGFALPPTLEGINTYIMELENRRSRLEQRRISTAERDGLMSETFVTVEKILKDLANFYICFIWPDTIEQHFELHEKKRAFNDLVGREFQVSKKEGLDRLMLGELMRVLQRLNERVEKDELLKRRVVERLEREELVPNSLLKMIEAACGCRPHFVHDTLKGKRNSFINTDLCQTILTDIINFGKAIADSRVYPCVLTIKREVTDEYGRTYVEATDDNSKMWIIKSTAWLEPKFAYYMHAPKYGLVAIDPFIIERLR